MPSPILVTGGSGTLGRLVVSRLRDAGRDVRVLSRTSPRLGPGTTVVAGDLMTGDGVELAVSGVETVVHCAGTANDDDVKALTLTRAALAAQVRHLRPGSSVAVLTSRAATPAPMTAPPDATVRTAARISSAAVSLST